MLLAADPIGVVAFGDSAAAAAAGAVAPVSHAGTYRLVGRGEALRSSRGQVSWHTLAIPDSP